MTCNVTYIDSSVTLECSKITIETKDESFIVIRFYDDQSQSAVHKVYLAPPLDSKFEYFSGKIESGDNYILMEAVNAPDDTTKST